MRTCQSCGKQNPDDRDFCDCGEYLRWDPTGIVSAITPEMAAAAEAAAPPDPAAPQPPAPEPAQPAAPLPPVNVAPPAAPAQTPGNGHQNPLPATPPTGTAVQGAVPPPAAPPAEPEVEQATITLRLPDEDAVKGEALAVGVHPGDRARVKALIRNQSGIVDNYQVSVAGLPEEWVTVLPDTVYLVPYGAGGTYEQEIEIHLHPPRVAEAEARIWELEVIAHSKAQERTAATAPLLLGIQPFEEHKTKVKPERASGRRKAEFKVAVENKANAPVYVAFDAVEPDNECAFRFDPPAAEIAPGESVTTNLRVRPPKQIWIGRPVERRLEVQTKAGEEAHALEAAAAEAAEAEAAGGGRGMPGLKGKKIPGVDGPRIYKPQVYKPNVFLGPGGLQVQKPQVRGPQMQGPHMRGMNLNLNQLKMGGNAAPPAVTGPLLPTQAVYRQKPWLPWWVAIVIPLLALLALLLFLFLPKNTTVPDVVGKKSAFEAEKVITESGLKLAAQVKEKVDPKAAPGSIVGQTPKAGETVEKESEVSILVAVGNGKVTVPSVVGKTPGEAEQVLRKAGLSLGQATPQPADPEAKIKSQIPAEKEVVKEGAPVDIFLVTPEAKKAGNDGPAVAAGGAGGAGGDSGGAGGGGEGGDITVPPTEQLATDAYAQKVGELKLAPVVKPIFDADHKKGDIVRVDPEPGTKAEAGATVTIFTSAGFPNLAFDNDKDILLVNAAQGKTLDPIAKGSQDEGDPTWSFDGSAVAFTSDGQVFLKQVDKKDAVPIPLTKEGEDFTDLAWGPTADINNIAMLKRDGGSTLADTKTSLCFERVTADGGTPNCKDPSDFVLGRKINWSFDGKTLLVFGASRDATKFGMVGYESKKPFSTNPDDWESKGFVTDTSQTGQGVLDAAFSPDGKQLAVVNLGKSGRPELMMTTPDDVLLANAKSLKVIACKVIWRPDGQDLVIVRSDDCFSSETGNLIRLSPRDPKDQTSLNLAGDNPVFQPITPG